MLVSYLKKVGAISGFLQRKTRHSELSVIKSMLLAEMQQKGLQAHNNFGIAVHETFLETKRTKRKLTPQEQTDLKGMVVALQKDSYVTILMRNTIREKRIAFQLNGVRMGGTPDAKSVQHSIVNDLKTTVCTSLTAFVAIVLKYGYIRQAITYLRATGLKHYYIIGIQKQSPYRVYIVHVTANDKQSKLDFEYAEQELAFLLYFYKHYGIIKPQIL